MATPARGPLGPFEPLVRAALRVGAVLQVLLVIGAIAVFVRWCVPQLQAAAQRQPSPLPPSMEAVDWSSPASSRYCLACHRQVGRAIGLRDVALGHPQNVPLDANQLQAVHDLGTIAGPGNTLICTSCHRLGQEPNTPHMLADTLEDGKLCERCHTGHYARGTPHDLRISAPTARNRAGETTTQGGPCSACHLAHRYARDFEPTPLDPDGRCITCHSSNEPAAAHARQKMDHPQARCLECHNPHDPKNTDFLRAAPAELCLKCHANYSGGLAAGMHPLGELHGALPAALVAAGGAEGNAQAKTIDCLTCHSMHKGSFRPLLVLDPQSNDLCLACHRDELAKHGRDGRLPKHGQSPKLTAAQRAVVANWQTRTGPDGELLCLSCHRVHNAQHDTPVLAFTPKYGEVCGACHTAQTAVAGTAHDLRTNKPDVKNRLGLTAAAGECSACHLAHGDARPAAAGPGDRAGVCSSCHSPEGCAADRLAGEPAHPAHNSNCQTCHDPHTRTQPQFLKQPESELCVSCHRHQSGVAGGPHDRSKHADGAAHSGGDSASGSGAAPGPGDSAGGAPSGAGLCTSCHLAHGGGDRRLLRHKPPADAEAHDGACLACHHHANWGMDSPIAALHPRGIDPNLPASVQLVPSSQPGKQQIGCRTCHDPHAGAKPEHLARVKAGDPSAAVCLQCHQDKQYVRLTGHSADNLQRFGFETDSCKPCHAMHAKPTESWGQVLSPRFIMPHVPENLRADVNAVLCEACHRADGPAPARAVSTHPKVIMTNTTAPGDPGYLPLFNDKGQVDPFGGVACRTCHVSHGRTDLLQQMAGNANLTPAEQHAIRVQVRQFVEPNICTECHKEQARTMFLNFHNAARRGHDGG